MNESRKYTDRQYRLIASLVAVIIYSLVVAVFFIIPEKFHSHYSLLLSVVFLIDVLLLPSLKKQTMSRDEKWAYPLFVIMGLGLILASSILLYLDLQPKYWIFSFITVSSLLTGLVVYQFLRNRKIIP